MISCNSQNWIVRIIDLSKEWVNFVDFFDRIIDRFEMAKEQNVSFKRQLPNHAIFVEIDEDKMTQVLYNIISNAIKVFPGRRTGYFFD